jgi:hypothetical protein
MMWAWGICDQIRADALVVDGDAKMRRDRAARDY